MKQLLGKLSEIFKTRQDEAFVTLMQVALESPAIREHLILLLSLPHAERSARLRQWRQELQAEGAPELLLTTLVFLEDEQRANRALAILSEP